MTLKEIISDLKKILLASPVDSSERINDANLRFKIDKYRMDYIMELEMQGTDPLPKDLYQVLKFENLTEESLGSGLMNIKVGATEELNIPDLNLKEVNRISLTDRRSHIDYVSQEYFYTMLSLDSDEPMLGLRYATLEEGKIKISGGANVSLSIEAITADPIAAYVSSGIKEKEAWKTRKYPVDGKAAFYVVLNILTRDFNLQTRMVADLINDGQDQFKIERYGDGPKMLQPDVLATPEQRGRKGN